MTTPPARRPDDNTSVVSSSCATLSKAPSASGLCSHFQPHVKRPISMLPCSPSPLAFSSPLVLCTPPVNRYKRNSLSSPHLLPSPFHLLSPHRCRTPHRHLRPDPHPQAPTPDPLTVCNATSTPSSRDDRNHKTHNATRLQRVAAILTNLFPVWTTAASVVALRWPAAFASFTSSNNIQSFLSILMLSTGLTLSPRDLRGVLRKPRAVLFAFVACYVLMPALALVLAAAFRLQGTMRAGLLLLSIVSGGQMSNLCTHVAGGDTALSVAMTTATTLSAAIVLPTLSQAVLGTMVPVDGRAVALSTARVTLAPIAVGVALNGAFGGVVHRVRDVLPLVGIAAVVALVLGPVATSGGGLAGRWSLLVAPVLLLHLVGGLVGFAGPMLMGGCGRAVAVATAFETAFKSPALSYVLARRLFPPGVEVASMVSIVVLAPCAALCAVLVRGARKGWRSR